MLMLFFFRERTCIQMCYSALAERRTYLFGLHKPENQTRIFIFSRVNTSRQEQWLKLCEYIHMYTYIHTYIHTNVCIRTHAYIHTCIHACTRTHVHACTHTRTHTCIHTVRSRMRHSYTGIHNHASNYTKKHTSGTNPSCLCV
jgi:hypothetical protein